MSTPEYLFHHDGNTYTNRRQSSQTLASPNRDNHKDIDITNEFHPQYQYLKKWFESRLRGISEDIRGAFKLVQSDALIETMKQDPASEEYVHQRVREIIEDCLANDREALLEKLAMQYNHLKSEYDKLESQHEQTVFEMKSRIEKLQEQCKAEARNREHAEDQAQTLKGSLNNLTKNYEGALHQSQAALEQEIDTQRLKNKDIEHELNKTHQIIEEYEKGERELRRVIKGLEEENAGLGQDLVQMRTQKKEMENKFRRITEEMASENEQNTEKLHKTYKEKIDQYKKKLLEYKARVGEKDQEIQNLQRRHEEDQRKLGKSIEILEGRLQDQMEASEQTARGIEEENYHRMSEMREQYENQLKEVQDQLKNLLEQKVSQLQDDAEERINQIKGQEKELQLLLEEKALEMERDYIRLDYYERIVAEKNELLEKFKDDIQIKEAEHRQELSSKLKNLEERLTEEHNARQRAVKATISELEQQIKELTDTAKRFEQESRLWSGEKKALKESIEQLETQKRQAHESIEEWATKSKKLKAACDDEQARRNDLEKEIRNQQERYREIREKLDEALRETDEKGRELQNMHQEGLNLENVLKEENRERKRLEKELDMVTRDLLETRDSLKFAQDDGKALREESKRLGEALKTETEKYEREAAEHLKVRTKLKGAEDQLGEMKGELEDKEENIEQLNSKLDQLEKQNRQLNTKNEENREKIEELYKEKLECERRVDQVMIKTANFRRNTVVKLDSLKAELIEVKSINNSNIDSISRLFKSKLFELSDRINFVMEQKEHEHDYDMKLLRDRLDGEFTRDLENLKAEYYYRLDLEKQTHEEKMRDQLKQLDYKEEANSKLLERLNELGKEMERRDVKQAQLKDEFMEIKKEKERIVLQLEQANQTYIKDLEMAQEDLKKSYEEAAKERRGLDDKYSKEVSQLKKEIEKLKENNDDTVRSYENRLKDLERNHEEELVNTRRHYEDNINRLDMTAKTFKGTEDMLIAKVNKLDNKSLRLKKRVGELEQENKDLKEMYEKKLQMFETRMVEVNKMIEKENEEVAMFREEKMNEIDQCLKTMHLLQVELRAKNDKIATLLDERSQMDYQMRDAENELTSKLDFVDRQKQELLEKTIYQSKEIEQLHQLLSKSHRQEDTRRREAQDTSINTSKSIHYRPKKDYIRIEKGYDPHETSSYSQRNPGKEKSRSVYFEGDHQTHSTHRGETMKKKHH